MRIFLDANILFSGAKSDGAIRRLIGFLLGAGHECQADAFVCDEARRNLLVKAPDSIAAFEDLLSRITVSVVPATRLESEWSGVLPDKDRPVLAAAIRLHCDYLVTGDRIHFGPLYGEEIEGVRVCSPSMLAQALLR
jgi:hypothetical protein